MKPRHQPIVITAENQLKRLRERYSRRELIQLLGGVSVASIAGCGGGGEGTPTATATSGGGDQPTPTATPQQETERSTPTETEAPDTPTETSGTPAGAVEVTDQWIHQVTTQNFEQIHPNPWNTEAGTNPVFQAFPLTVGPTTQKIAPPDDPLAVLFPLAAETLSLDFSANELTMELRENLEWGDGTAFNAENVLMHDDIMRATIEIGESSEVSLPQSIEAVDERTVRMKFLPGNAGIRLFDALYEGRLRQVSDTHPVLHREFIENIRDATTTSAKQRIISDLFSERFPQSDFPKMALGPFKATRWNPSQFTFEARSNFPWGLGYHEVDRVFAGVRWASVSEQTQLVNAAVGGKKDWVVIPSMVVAKRFDQNKWTILQDNDTSSTEIAFSPKSKFGKKTEKSRNMRKAVAYLFDNEEYVAINDLYPAYEQTTGYSIEEDFKNWIGEDTFSSWTNYGKGDTGYVFEEKGYRRFREAGFERSKDGNWIDGKTGEPLAPELTLPQPGYSNYGGMTRPMMNNIAEQLNRHGIETTAKIPSSDEFENRVPNQEFDLAVLASQTDVNPHPFVAYNEDMGLGSIDGLPSGIHQWDWRNGYRRVQVPMPVGNPDGEMTTYDWDRRVQGAAQLDEAEDIRARFQELSWVMNQWVPCVFLKAQTVIMAVRSPDRITFSEDFDASLAGEGNKEPAPLLIGGGFWTPA